MTNIEEIWEDLPYCTWYQVSNLGKVRSKERPVKTHSNIVKYHKPKSVSLTDNGHGYKIFGTRVNYLKKNFYIHRVVAGMFVPNPMDLPEVNHKDGDKSNNAYFNLEWVDRQGNVDHAIRSGLSKDKLILNTETGIFYKNVSEAMASISYTRTKHNFRRIVRGLYPTIKSQFIYA